MKITLRRAKVEDASFIAEAERQIAKEPGIFCSQPDELTDENVANTISCNSSVYLVAECEGTVVAHAFLKSHALKTLSHVADLNIAVHLGWQGKGVGTRILEEIIEWAKKSSTIEKIQLRVRASNTRAIRLYKRMGFQEEGRLKKRVKLQNQYLDDLVMGLDLFDNLQLTLREMEESDIETLTKAFCFPWTTQDKTREKWTRYFKEQQEKKRIVYLVEGQEQILGYGSLVYHSEYPHFRNEKIPEIHDVWVHENFRKQGAGKMLIQHLEKIALVKGYKRMGLGVGLYRDYGSAQILYSKLGYIPDGNGVTFKTASVIPGEKYPVDDDLLLWLTKSLI